ncbi:MAG: hypothetical protein B6I24_10785 [Bacteroidetes bacterium 4572_128]|nr:MAG: hypothetical protein B6I24_10785 [Bacteroidetes bacterium 4572_128]
MNCKKSINKKNCNCSYPCSIKGICCDCIAIHRKKAELPACYFPNDIEKNYDRSIETFIKIYQKRGGRFLK